MKIFLARHGETTGDIEDRYGGDYDDHLTDLGKNEAGDLAQKLKGRGIEKIFTSPKIRAQETTAVVNKELGLEVEIVEDLRERNQYGILTGMIKTEAKAKNPDLAILLKDYKNTIVGAEDYDSFSERVHQALFSICKTNHKAVLVVAHGGALKAVLRKIRYSFDYKIEDCAFAELECDGLVIKVIQLNGILPA